MFGDSTEEEFIAGFLKTLTMKTLTIPKLELQAGLLAARIKKHVEDSLEYKVEDVFM